MNTFSGFWARIGMGSAGLLIGAATTLPAAAQDQADERARRSGVIEEVIVTARKIAESVQDVPIAMTALSQELESPTIRNLIDLNGYSPNVQIGQNGSRAGGGADIIIRGISPTRTDDNSFDSPIAVMIDGIYLGSLAGQVLDNFDLERIEILRGPQGTLFGKNTVGGVIHVIRSRPTGELGATVRATIGNDAQREFRAVVNTPVIEDVLAAKLFGTFQQDDGYRSNATTGNDFGDRDYQNYGATLLLTPNERFEALFTIEKFKDEGRLNAFHTNFNAAPGVIPPPTNPRETDYSGGFTACAVFPQACRTSLKTPGKSENDTDNDAKLDIDAYTLNMSYDINDNLRLVSVTGYREMYEYRIFDFDGSSAPFITIERWNDHDQFSQELRIDGTWENLTMTAGAYYWKSEFEQDWVTGAQFWSILFGGVAANPFLWGLCQNQLPGTNIWCDSGIPNGIPLGETVTQILYEKQTTTSVAAFFQLDYTFAENWTVTAGLRWTEEEKDFKAGQAYLSNVERQRLRNFPGYADLDNTWREWTPRLGLTYRIDDRQMVYASYAEGFHSGGFFGVNQNIADFERDQYDPEYGKTYEIGYKGVLFDDKLRLNGTVFYTDFKDKQESFIALDPSTNTVASVFSNAASAIYWGVELELEYVFSEYFRAFVNYGYLDAEYDKFETDIDPTDGQDIIEDASFLKPRNAPENTVGVGGTFTYPIAAGYLQIFGKYAWVDDVETNLLNASYARIDARKDVTASIGYYADRWSVTAFGRNLTDERFETFFPVADLFATGTVNRPRSYGVELQFEF